MLSSLKESGQPLSNTSRNSNDNQDLSEANSPTFSSGIVGDMRTTALVEVYSSVIADMTEG